MKDYNRGIPLLLMMGLFLIFAVNCNKEEGEKVITYGSFFDIRDSNEYQTTTIGSQVWMAENLKYLPFVVEADKGSDTISLYYVYDYHDTLVANAKATINYETYGVLYNWPAAMAGSSSSSTNASGVQGVCPYGWHLPSLSEWNQLIDYVTKSYSGQKLKEAGTSNWPSNPNATNETGFTARPGGFRRDPGGGGFFSLNLTGNWWSSTEYGSYGNARFMSLSVNSTSASLGSTEKSMGCSVRCLKD